MSSPQASANVGGPALSEGQAPPPGKTELVVKRLGDLRDGLLLLAGVLYLLGYLSWALYALDTGIGLVPVLDSQYFAAGIVPALIVLLFVGSVRLLRRLQEWLKSPLHKNYQSVPKALSYCAGALIIIFWVLKMIFGTSSPQWVTWLAGSVLVLMLVAAFFGRAKGDRFVQLMGLFLLWTYTIFGAVWLFLGYNLKIFPRLPSELGGPKPRCVQLDVDTSLLSAETRAQLRGQWTASATPPVVRSVPLYLIFDGTEYVLLSDRADSLLLSKNVFRLRKESLKAMFPCSSSETKSVAP